MVRHERVIRPKSERHGYKVEKLRSSTTDLGLSDLAPNQKGMGIKMIEIKETGNIQAVESTSVKKRIKLTVAYDGTAYHGWQVQGNANTIEGELNRHLSELLGEDIMVTGASRTDTGVHALCNIAVFDTASRIPAPKFVHALNQRLPEDIRVRKGEYVHSEFHPRKVLCEKTYSYSIVNAKTPDPTRRLYSHFTHIALDADKMNEAARYLVGEHDFKSFCSVHSTAKTTVRRILWADVRRQEDEIRIRVCGNGFLYHMVRIIAGTLMEVGRGAYEPERIKEILEARDRTKAGPTAPAKGLTLAEYHYPDKSL